VENVDIVEALPTGTVTFLFTDIEGSTPLWDAYPNAMREALERHDVIVRKAIVEAEGHVFSTGGDGFGAVFARAANAVAAAVGVQQTLDAEPWPEHVALRVRMGMHTGEAQEREGDYFGPPVNRAARLMGAANGGQVVLSALTAELLGESSGLDLVDLGSVQLKGVVDPVHAFGVDAEGAEWIDQPLVSSQRSVGNLARLHTDFVGDLVDLQSRVSSLSNARLVTLTGSGGVGKTRAAVEIGWLVVDEFMDGVWMIELAPIADPDVVIAAVASTLSVQPQAGTTVVEAIVDWCADRRLLLILDNCEHVLEPAMELVSAIVAGCPTVTVIATSREPLGVSGEAVIRVPSLAEGHGIELFCDRASAADGAFVPSSGDMATIADICSRLDGIPLAIELAAARIRSLSPDELLARLDDRFRLLRGGGRGGLERHQTLRAAVTWSYQLLGDMDRLLFDRLSVFAGGFDLAAAEEVCAGDGIDEYDVVDVVSELVDKSMVIAERTGLTTRYRLLETMRQYGEERLDDRGETVTIRDRHLAHYREIAAGVQELWCSPEQLRADTIADCEWANFRAAHAWALTMGEFDQAVRLLSGLHSHTVAKMKVEFDDWAIRTIELSDRDGRTSALLYGLACVMPFFKGSPAQTVDLADRCLAIAGDEDELAIAMSLAMRSYGLAVTGQLGDEAALVGELRGHIAMSSQPLSRFYCFQAIIDMNLGSEGGSEDIDAYAAAAESIGAPAHIARSHFVRGNWLLHSGDSPDIDGAIGALREARVLADSIGATEPGTWARSGLAWALVSDSRSEASIAVRDSLSWAVSTRIPFALSANLQLCAAHLASSPTRSAAATILGHQKTWFVLNRGNVQMREIAEAGVADLDDLDALKAKGASMSVNELVAFTLAHLDSA
jgi:predicted ATPase/class 3 adenylate cyclase